MLQWLKASFQLYTSPPFSVPGLRNLILMLVIWAHIDRFLTWALSLRFLNLSSNTLIYLILCPYQSAYRKFHSTETVLVKVHNDIITAIDCGDIGALALTSAFDTVDHQILLDVLCQRFAVNDLALVSAFFISRLDYMAMPHFMDFHSLLSSHHITRRKRKQASKASVSEK